jgi:hypothetical protein
LRSKLHENLYSPIQNLTRRVSWKYKKDVLWAYHAALDKTETWPIEIEGNNKCINELIGLLRRDFKYVDPHPKGVTCTDRGFCSGDFDSIVQNAVNHTRDQFNGLCLGTIIPSTFQVPMP